MFNNLIESRSHAREFKRRGSFLLFTVATYMVLFVIAGVASIYAYDAQLSEPGNELELVSFIPPQPDKVVPEPTRVRPSNPATGAVEGPRSTRPELLDRTDNPLNPPKGISSVASAIPPARPDSEIGKTVMDPPGSGPKIGDSTKGGGDAVVEVRTAEPPPMPPPVVKPVPKIISKGPITGLALSLPKPSYPPIAKQAGAKGPVNVEVLIDETGKVISARAVTGNPLLRVVAQQAAFAARFSPTRLGDQPVKVSGVITYNFVLE